MRHSDFNDLFNGYAEGIRVRIIGQDAQLYGQVGEVKAVEDTAICVTLGHDAGVEHDVLMSPDDLELA